jgi:DNA-binding NarL/FixJ family response regulator
MEVLLVDDQAVTVQVYAAIVRKTFSGARVHVAVDLTDGVQLANGHKVDLVLLDLTLPNSSGVQTLLSFRKASPAIPVVVVAATEDEETIRACLEAGARGYVPKTSAIATLAGALQVVTAGGTYVPPEAQRSELKPAANGRA